MAIGNEYNNGMELVGSQSLEDQLKNLNELLGKEADLRSRAEDELQAKRLQHERAAAEFRVEQVKNSLTKQEQLELTLQEELLAKQKKNAEELTKIELDQAMAVNKVQQKYADAIKKAEDSGDSKELEKLQKKQKKELDWINKKAAAEKKNLEDQDKLKEKQDKKAAKEKAKANAKAQNADIFGKGKTLQERAAGLKAAFTPEEGGGKGNGLLKGLNTLAAGIADLSKQLENQIDQIGSYKSAIDTRLQGSTINSTKSGSYWDQLSTDIKNNIGASPLVKQSAVAENLKTMVNKGISYNVEQRAFLETVKDRIATTFDANNGVLLRLVRIQQQDTTASRLGMESALNSFLNNMYETTEYMSDVATSVKNNLEDSMALMTAKDAVGYEYQVQKWLGSMYSTGLSSSAISSISSALGNISSGKLEGLTSGGVGNLIAMAASATGMELSTILAKGLDEDSTNKLMQAMVNYLAGIYDESKGNRVVQQQIANVYGLSAADLKAIANMATDTKVISTNFVNYNTGLEQLSNMMNTIGKRTSTGEKMANAFDNFKYTVSAGIANNPVLYSMYKISGLLDSTMGGIEFSLPMVMGTGTAQTFNVADLMMTGALSASMLGGLGSMVSSLGDVFSGSGNRMANKFGIYNGTTLTRGSGTGLITAGGATVSESGYVGNGASDDIMNKTMTDTSDSSKQQTAEATQNEESDVTNKVINESINSILLLLQSVVDGTATLNVTTRTETLSGAWA